jgi:acetamidase/formamidase
MADHYYEPTVYYSAIGDHAPVLRIRDGDRVFTSTVDARGWDRDGNRTGGMGGNPMTGPFYVEGAEPGDTLVIRFERIVPNRDWGWTADVLAEHVLDPDAVRGLPERRTIRWTVDAARGIATPEEPLAAAGKPEVTLAPFLGCFGVAPSGGQRISMATSGPYGGNMDYRGFQVGVAISFPVFVEGALFHLGDGHAAQGDGEIAGTGIEISMDVAFTVALRKGRTIRWPWGETDDSIFTVGNARPLDQALRHATTEMMRRLRDDYGLDAATAGLILGQCVEYEVGNVFNPAYTMVCKLRKRYLPEPGAGVRR